MGCLLPHNRLVSRVGLELLAISVLTAIIFPDFTWPCARGPSLWVLFGTRSTWSALLRNPGYSVPMTSSLVSALLLLLPWWSALFPIFYFTQRNSPECPFQMQLVLGVEGQTYKRQWQVFFFVNSGQNGAPHFTVVLHSNVFNGKSNGGLTVR